MVRSELLVLSACVLFACGSAGSSSGYASASDATDDLEAQERNLLLAQGRANYDAGRSTDLHDRSPRIWEIVKWAQDRAAREDYPQAILLCMSALRALDSTPASCFLRQDRLYRADLDCPQELFYRAKLYFLMLQSAVRLKDECSCGGELWESLDKLVRAYATPARLTSAWMDAFIYQSIVVDDHQHAWDMWSGVKELSDKVEDMLCSSSDFSLSEYDCASFCDSYELRYASLVGRGHVQSGNPPDSLVRR